MPKGMIDSFAKKSGKSAEEVEKAWREAKEIVKKEYGELETKYGVVVKIMKNKLGLNENEFETLLEFYKKVKGE